MNDAKHEPNERGAANSAKWRRLRDLFGDVRELPESERAAFLDRELAGEPDLRGELDSFLASDATAGTFLAPRDSTGSGAAAAPSSSGSIGPGSAVGPYRLVELLGEGGFGMVYLAEQDKPIRRRVALKLIKPGMDTRQVIARFGAERQALALMDHPSIAQVFEAGETDAGRPYFAMEYVPGAPITAFCDAERLPVRERLELFLVVCDAVQHAHQRAVIHRDLKPSNILVARRDGVPALKVIDFGIVKATTGLTGERSIVTREGVVLGTIGYMSPEQAGAIQAEVDTRSDIYSLGVVLYELLTGELPFDRARLRRADWSEAVRIIREEDPPSLAARLTRGDTTAPATESGQRLAQVAQRRAADERTLRRELTGELDWIVQRALEKEPDRRYASASELSADIRRHLANEPVLARAPSTMYRVRKFARRHRAGVAAVALVMLAIVAGGIAATVGFTRAIRAEHAARREAESSKQVTGFLVDLFRASSPDQTQGQELTARMLLDEGTRKIESALENDPHVRVRVLAAISESYQNLGHFDEAIRIARQALAAAEAAEPEPGIEVARQLHGLAQALDANQSSDSVLVLADKAIAILEGPHAKDTNLLARCFYRKGSYWSDHGEGAVADSLLDLSLSLLESEAVRDTTSLLHVYSTKAYIAHRQFDLREAERMYQRTLELSQHGKRSSWSIFVHRRLANVYQALGDAEKTTHHADEGVKLARQIYAAGHPSLADALGGQADALAMQGRLDEASAVREEVLRIRRVAKDPLYITYELTSLGNLYRETGRLDLAIERCKEACATGKEGLGPEHERTGEAIACLARCYLAANRTDEAEATFREAIAVFDGLEAPGIFGTLASMDYATICRDIGHLERADSFFVRAESGLDSTNAVLKPYRGACLVEHGYLRALQGRHTESEAMMQAGYPLLGEPSADGPDLADAYLKGAAARARAGDERGVSERLALAARHGATATETAKYVELAAYRSRSDFPKELL